MVKPRPLSLLLSCSSDHSVSIKIAVTYPMASASAAILVLFDSTAFSANVIVFSVEIICMTGSAVRRILGPTIHKRTDYAIAVAAATPRVPSVVARVFPSRAMFEDAWRPAVC